MVSLNEFVESVNKAHKERKNGLRCAFHWRRRKERGSRRSKK